MSAIGANPAQLDSLAYQFDQLATSLGHRRIVLTAWIEGDRFWRGRRADEFRHLWASEYSSQLGNAVGFLQAQVRILRDNANQQRVASGEEPKDYGSSFVKSLWGNAEKGVETVSYKAAHGISDMFHRAEHGVEDVGHHVAKDVEDSAKSVADGATYIAQNAYSGFKELGGSPLFQKFIQEASVVSDVAGILAVLPIPGVQEAAIGVALAASVIVMTGHLAEMANEGRFDGGEFAEDALSVGGGVFGEAAAASKAADAAKAVDDANLVTQVSSVKDVAPTVMGISGASPGRVIEGLQVAHDVASSGVETWQTTDHVVSDVKQGNYLAAVNDGLGYVDAAGDLMGVKGQIVGGGAATERDLNAVIYE